MCIVLECRRTCSTYRFVWCLLDVYWVLIGRFACMSLNWRLEQMNQKMDRKMDEHKKERAQTTKCRLNAVYDCQQTTKWSLKFRLSLYLFQFIEHFGLISYKLFNRKTYSLEMRELCKRMHSHNSVEFQSECMNMCTHENVDIGWKSSIFT